MDIINNSQVYMKPKLEDYCPSLKQKNQRRKTLPFASSLRHVKNVDMMLQCEECNMWRLLYSKQRLLASEREKLEEILNDFSFTCGHHFKI